MRLQQLWFVLAGVIAFPFFAQAAGTEVAPGVEFIGTIQSPDITESSGIVATKKARGALWTHNDGGQDIVYSISSTGESLGEWKIKDVDLQNIEDIAAGPGGLYLAAIGNDTRDRKEVTVVRIPEPPANRSGEVSPTRIWTLKYPGGEEFDAESFFVLKGSGYIISKDDDARIYRFPLNKSGTEFELEKMCKLNVGAKPTGADITKDGKRLAVITGAGAYLFTLTNGIPDDGTLDPALFVPYSDGSMEGCTFTPDGLVVTSEGRNLYLFTDPQFHVGSKTGGRKNRR
jgi:hypothetical protein